MGRMPSSKRLDEIARRLHSLKGDARHGGPEMVRNQAHLFESELQRIRQSGAPAGDLGGILLRSCPLPLEDLLTKGGCPQEPGRPAAPGSGKRLARQRSTSTRAKLAQDVAAGSGKKVTVRGPARQPVATCTKPRSGWCARSPCSWLAQRGVCTAWETPQVRSFARGQARRRKRSKCSLVRDETEWTLA
jgi:chemotaxis protein histidine kinase CheA